MNTKICIIGLGYIGLPTAALLASRGYQIHGVDVNAAVVETINQGKIHIVEPDLDDYVKTAVSTGRLKADVQPCEAGVFIIAVPTPFHPTATPDECPKPNVDYVVAATEKIAPYVRAGNLVILESTSPVGTTERVQAVLQKMRPELFNSLPDEVFVAHCPERVLPGKIMHELVHNDRIVGGVTQAATQAAAEFYRGFVQGEVLETDARTAEMCKLTENSFRDVNIAFANELSMICDKLDINVWELIRLANRHPRVNILQPGPGVGGHCIAVDPWFIVDSSPEEAKLIRTAREVNNYKSAWVIEKIKNAALTVELEQGRKPVIACLGLAFKPDIDDLRESPALHIVRALTQEHDHIVAVEPNISTDTDPATLGVQNPKFRLLDLIEAGRKADIFVLLVAHKEFKQGIRQLGRFLDFCGVTQA
jgi:UDP-N-acetyl-D-mannosaminuronic acid dehydrogenase